MDFDRERGFEVASEQAVEGFFPGVERVAQGEQQIALPAEFRLHVQAVGFEDGLFGQIAVCQRRELRQVFQSSFRAGNLALGLDHLVVGLSNL